MTLYHLWLYPTIVIENYVAMVTITKVTDALFNAIFHILYYATLTMIVLAEGCKLLLL